MRISSILMPAAVAVAVLGWQVAAVEARSGASEAPAKNQSGQTAAKPAPGQRPAAAMREWGKNREEMYKAIGVTAQQRKQLDAIDEKYRQKAKELRDADLTREQRRSRMMELIQARQAEVDRVLTPEQKKKREQWIEEQRRKRRAEMGERRERPAGDQDRPAASGKPAGPRK
jgi:Spy/CpxP family protein refolding chaperone